MEAYLVLAAFWHLLQRSAALSIASRGTTALAIFIAVLGDVLRLLRKGRKDGWPAVRKEWMGEVGFLAVYGTVAWLVVLGLSMATTIYKDHTTLVISNTALVSERNRLRSQNEELQVKAKEKEIDKLGNSPPKIITRKEAPAMPPPSTTINAPGGMPITGGTVSNPTVINNSPPPPRYTFTEEVVTPVSTNAYGFKVMKVHIHPDRAVPGAIIGIVFSGPIEQIRPGKDEPQLKGAGISQMNWGEGLATANGTTVPNSLGVTVNAPAAFLPNQDLILTVNSKTDVHVIEIGPVGAR